MKILNYFFFKCIFKIIILKNMYKFTFLKGCFIKIAFSGFSVRVTTQGAIKSDGIFISRLVEGGLAESTGLLGVNDEVIEVNGIDVKIYF